MVTMIRWLIERDDCQGWAELSPRLTEAYIDDRLRHGRSPATINWDLIHFRGFCQFARDEGRPLPEAITKVRNLDTPRGLPRPLPDKQVRRLERCIREAITQAKTDHQRELALRDRACFYLLWHCGLRIREASDLLVSDLDLGGGKLFVRNSKERKDRMLYVSPTTVRALQQYLAVREKQEASNVFQSERGTLTPSGIRERLEKYGRECGVPVTARRLRHTFASQMLAAGMPIVSLQRYLGHEHLDTTLIYAEVSDPKLQRDYYLGAATFDPASAELARQALDLSEREELRQLIGELRYPDMEPEERREVLEQMERILAESERKEESSATGQDERERHFVRTNGSGDGA
jgi:integrase/recombinase XerC